MSAGPARIEADVVIVGAGSAGCALAGRLRTHGAHEVLLIEEGPDPSPWPAAGHAPLDDAGRLDAAYDPATSRGDRVDLGSDAAAELRRGAVLGGSSAVNGTYFVHAREVDVARWESATGGAWDAARVRRLVARLETDLDLGDRAGHGAAGPVPVSRDRTPSTITEAFFEACAEQGHVALDDLNDRRLQSGFGFVPRNVRDGRRVSAAAAYLTPSAADEGLTVLADTVVEGLVREGTRVVGLVAIGPDGPIEVQASQVVLCAGAVGSPTLLRRSGLDLPAARPGDRGWNHPVVELMYRPRPGVVDAGVDGFFQGALHTPAVEVMATRLPYGVVTGTSPTDDLLSLRVTLLDPKGVASLEQDDGDTAVRQDPLAHPEDRAALRVALRQVCELAASDVFAGLVAQWHGPGPAELADDARLDGWLRRHTVVAFHLAGTCPVGSDPSRGAVVDPSLRVHGVDGLRIADASVLPAPLSRGPAATAVLVGELAAEELAGTPSPGS